ncbi:DNA damage-inducible transcript 4-like protein-like isoform X2 [Betta splendens]|uniref:DNA damage-inducible transcript 4-like protein-like isoform X2 n=1 Tax=Betta splendens TaxID=158456 RepID=A0A6P7NP47_BETSP|nr:DNA damage-inducible transcript 4-like protein-like isoform X2 [Betta splendens]
MVYSTALLFGGGLPVLTEEEMIGNYFFHPTSPRSRSAARRGSVESCEDAEKHSPFSNLDLEHEEQLLLQDVTRRIERCLTEAKASALHCTALLLPRHMIQRVGQDLMHLCTGEPCGLRGASIRVSVELKDGARAAGSVRPDPGVTPTFELSVIFRADKDGGWPPFKNMFDASKVLKLRAEYRLVKRKLYSSASPVVQDFY